MVYLLASAAQKQMVSVLWFVPSSRQGQRIGLGALAWFSCRSSSAVARALTLSLAAMFAGSFALSNLLMTSYYMTAPRAIVRYDHLFYGRYNDAVIAVLSAIGLLALSKFALQRAALSLTATTAAVTTVLAVVVRWRVTHIELSESFPPTSAGLAVFVWSRDGASRFALERHQHCYLHAFGDCMLFLAICAARSGLGRRCSGVRVCNTQRHQNAPELPVQRCIQTLSHHQLISETSPCF
jgi:hypothetical protein